MNLACFFLGEFGSKRQAATNSAGSAVAQSAATGVVSGSVKNPKVRALA
jgi:hypothetical protein